MPQLLLINRHEAESGRLALAMGSLGFDVDSATSLSEGVRSLREQLYDLVVLDAHLSDERPLGGLDLLDQIQRLQPDTPAVVLSRDPSPRVKREAWRRGANAYHEKPLDLMSFLHDVIQLCALSPRAKAPTPDSAPGAMSTDQEAHSV